MYRSSVRLFLVLGSLLGATSPAAAQSLGTFRWQLQPFCNVVSVTITQSGNVFRLEGTDDQCGVNGKPASAIGTAFLNADGSVALGLTLVTSPSGAPTHVMASISIATLGGTWRDSAGNTGAFVFTNGAASGGSPRPSVSGTITELGAGPGLRVSDIVSGAVRFDLAAAPSGAFDFTNANGIVSRRPAGVTSIPISGPGVRLMWYPGKAAFRAGEVLGTQWDDVNVGFDSVAMGLNTMASGRGSLAMGIDVASGGTGSVAFGQQVQANGIRSFAFGLNNVANGDTSVAMGEEVRTAGLNSVALGFHAVAVGNGSFVFGDRSSIGDIAVGENQFNVRAAGGTRFLSNAALTAGVVLAPGASAWASVSDVNMKEHFRDLDDADVLSKIARMPIREWSYKAQDPSIRHIGPTAQDFSAAFGLGEDPLKISTIDADGVALRAIQALEARTRAENETLRAELAALRDELSALKEVRR